MLCDFILLLHASYQIPPHLLYISHEQISLYHSFAAPSTYLHQMWRSLFILHLFSPSPLGSISFYPLLVICSFFGSGVGCVVLFLLGYYHIMSSDRGGGEIRVFGGETRISSYFKYEVLFSSIRRGGNIGGLREGSSEKYVITHQKVAFLLPTY